MRKIRMIIFLIIFLFLILFAKDVFALDPEQYKPNNLTYTEGETLFKKTAPVIKMITNIGIIGSVLALTIIGVQYMLGSSLEQKALTKEKMLPLICGCLLVCFSLVILKVIVAAV